MLGASPLGTDVRSDLVAARLPIVHPRLTWNAAANLHVREVLPLPHSPTRSRTKLSPFGSASI